MSLIGGPTCILGWSVDVVSPPLGLRRPGSPVSRRGVRPCVSVVRFGTVLGTLTVAFCDDTFGTRLRLGGTQRGGPRAPPPRRRPGARRRAGRPLWRKGASINSEIPNIPAVATPRRGYRPRRVPRPGLRRRMLRRRPGRLRGTCG